MFQVLFINENKSYREISQISMFYLNNNHDTDVKVFKVVPFVQHKKQCSKHEIPRN